MYVVERWGRPVSENQERISIVLAHPNSLYRQGITALLNADADFSVVGQAGDGDRCIETAEREQPDVVLIDCGIPGPPLETLIARIAALAPRTRTMVLLARRDDPGLLRRLVRLGVRAFLVPDGDRDELRSAVRMVVNSGDRVVMSIPRDMMRGLGESGRLLSRREVEVLRLVAKGLTNSEVGGTLFIAEGTVKRHLTNIYTKLGVRSRIQAVNKAFLLGVMGDRGGVSSHG
ncbi:MULTISPECIES: response regulator transcription factor [Streptomyces]|uniref:Response regulator transcription factor n=1 Tax=Streptomyces morookaense TaxID=1970 RepID=A0A7Y7B2E9_STRMO|nr:MULTISPECIES: response regulator transcription factor [Streptomyces]MCC2278262.1 response regulator transcription factor [Streptomyces sp. ET3-23]NVK77798.1 response regulator transcription factor [Streptomyces morookaense]GHF20001.1 DNA-binding response regulator [Streptomyces morookaense]